MSRVRVLAYTMTLDGFSAGPDQSLDNPLGVGGFEMMEWILHTRSFKSLHGNAAAEGDTGIDDRMVAESFVNVGAWVMGRNMFGPVRGPWPNHDWRGWWGEEPPYHCAVFVLTHHARPPLEMQGGTVFHFVTGGIHEALERARDAAGARDIRIGGGAATVRQYLQAGLIDDLHIAVRPMLMGRGENLFAGIDTKALGYAVDQLIPGERASHAIVRRR